MNPHIRLDYGNVSETTTWVCKVTSLVVPRIREALDDAFKKGLFIGLYVQSRSIVVHTNVPQTSYLIHRKIDSVMDKGGAEKKTIECLECLDFYHGEQWGLISVNPPDNTGFFDILVEGDDADAPEDSEANSDSSSSDKGHPPTAEELSTTVVSGSGEEYIRDFFALSIQDSAGPVTIRVPSTLEAILMETAKEHEIREALEASGDTLSPWLSDRIFQRDLFHARKVQEEVRTLARKRDQPLHSIVWLTPPPEFITLCAKPKMPLKRRVEWIIWRAAKLKLKLTLPSFMALLKQVSFFGNDRLGQRARLQQFKVAVEIWKGCEFEWKALTSEERNLIGAINEGRIQCYCRGCHMVLDLANKSQYCSQRCAAQFCQCGSRLLSRQVTDYDKMEDQNTMMGAYSHLVDLARMLRYREDIESWKTSNELSEKFRELKKLRETRGCCKAVEGFVNSTWCAECFRAHSHLLRLASFADLIRSQKVTWGQCQAAAEVLKKFRNQPLPKKEETFCGLCEENDRIVDICPKRRRIICEEEMKI